MHRETRLNLQKLRGGGAVFGTQLGRWNIWRSKRKKGEHQQAGQAAQTNQSFSQRAANVTGNPSFGRGIGTIRNSLR